MPLNQTLWMLLIASSIAFAAWTFLRLIGERNGFWENRSDDPSQRRAGGTVSNSQIKLPCRGRGAGF